MLAIVISSCDKHSFLWDGWSHYFQNWTYDYPVYFLTETKEAPVKTIKVNIPDVNLWTKRIRKSIEQIPEDNIFFMTEDVFITSKFKDFDKIYKTFKTINADSLRIRRMPSKYTTLHDTIFKINGNFLKKLDQKSKYLIAYSPNIFKKSFLLECLKHDETIWQSETKGSRRLEGKGYNIYSYLKPNWYGNACRKGKITPEGKKLLNYG